MARNHPTVWSVLVHTFEIARVNFLPMAVVAFVFITPFLPLLWSENYLLLLKLMNHKAYLCILTAVSLVTSTAIFYGAINGARGRQVGFRECLIRGIGFALPIVPSVLHSAFSSAPPSQRIRSWG